jgi:hypothetical protein
VPSTHTPSFDVDPNARFIPVNDLVMLTEPGRGYTHDDAGKNRLCPPNPYPDKAVDWISNIAIQGRSQAAWFEDSEITVWMERSRLNAARGLGDHMADPMMQSALTRMITNTEPAVANLEKFLAYPA